MIFRLLRRNLILALSLLINLIALTVAGLYVEKQGGLRYIAQKIGIAPILRHVDRALYQGRVDTFLSLAPVDGRWIFLGDSMTEFAPLDELFTEPTANRGLASDHVADIAGRRHTLNGSNPSGIAIWAGINDLLAKRSCDQTAGDIADLAEQLRLAFPNARVAVLEIAPVAWVSGQNAEQINTEVRCTNARLEMLLASRNIRMVKLYAALAENDRLIERYTVDGGHLNGQGYLAWARQISPSLGLTAQPSRAIAP